MQIFIISWIITTHLFRLPLLQRLQIRHQSLLKFGIHHIFHEATSVLWKTNPNQQSFQIFSKRAQLTSSLYRFISSMSLFRSISFVVDLAYGDIFLNVFKKPVAFTIASALLFASSSTSPS